MFKYKCLPILVLSFCANIANAYDTNMSPEIYRSYDKQQQKVNDNKRNTILVTPNYKKSLYG